jgi:carboxyl-terminal processing protease
MTPPRSPRVPLGPAIILLLALMAGGWFLQRGVAQDQNVYFQARLFQEVIDHIADRYVDPVDRNALYDFAIDGMIRSLDDPNTSLLNVEDYEDFRIHTEGDYGGIGLEIVSRDDHITVVSPLPGGPGSRAGVRTGDRIVRVDGESIRGWSTQQAVQLLRGRPGTEVEVTVERPGVEDPIEFTLRRDRIELRSVPFAAMLDGGVGYIPLDLFRETSAREVRAAADSLRDEGARALILDLRGNAGGVLEQGVGIADLFLERNAGVVETRGQRRDQAGTLRAPRDDRYPDLPLVVLVDRGSASASEIVAGSLQDHDRALVLGTTTFGKGSVQSLFSLTGGNVLKITTARWYTPRGRSIEWIEDRPETGEEPEAVPAERFAITLDGQFLPLPDTAGRPTVTSFGGRTLYGGGGIVPDLMVLSDTLRTDEQEAVRTLLRQGGRYMVGLFNYAVEYLQREEEIGPDFEVTDRDLDQLYERLREQGATVDRATFDRAARFTRYQLESQIATHGWDQKERFLRLSSQDAPLNRAVELLRDADSREALFALAGSPLPAGEEEPEAAASSSSH